MPDKPPADDPGDGREPNPERHYPELRHLAAIDPEFREWLGEAACPEVQRCPLWPTCSHESEKDPA